MDTDQRPAQPGELCTCGRQAVTAIDVPEAGAVEVALTASPDWVAPFLVPTGGPPSP